MNNFAFQERSMKDKEKIRQMCTLNCVDTKKVLEAYDEVVFEAIKAMREARLLTYIIQNPISEKELTKLEEKERLKDYSGPYKYEMPTK